MAFYTTKPAIGTTLRLSHPEILANWVALQAALGFGHLFVDADGGQQTGLHKAGSARLYSAAAASAPSKQEDGSTALAAADVYTRLWFDTTNSLVKILTNHSPVTWTSLMQYLGMLDEDNMASNSAAVPPSQQSVKAYVDSGTVTMANKTLTSPVLNAGVSGTAVLDEDNMASNSATKVATQQSIKAYVDAHASSVASGATVFNATVTAANTFQDLDLSAIVGAKTAWVFLEIFANNQCQIAVKPKGFGATFTKHTNSLASANGIGVAALDLIDANDFGYAVCVTNSSGVLQLGCNSNAVTLTIKLVAYIK